MENQPKKYPQKTLSDGFFSNPRPLHNSNVAKVSIESGLGIGLLWPKVSFLAYPNFWKIAVLNVILKGLGYTERPWIFLE